MEDSLLLLLCCCCCFAWRSAMKKMSLKMLLWLPLPRARPSRGGREGMSRSKIRKSDREKRKNIFVRKHISSCAPL